MFTYRDLVEMDLGKLGTAVGGWKTMADELGKLRTEVYDGLVQMSDAAKWEGVNATVTKDFVRGTAKEFLDLHAEAQSIHRVLEDAHAELTHIQKQVISLAEQAKGGDATEHAPPAPLMVSVGYGGVVRVTELRCTPEPASQRTKDLMQWYADTITGLVAHAAEIDSATTRALKASHGGDPLNAGHAAYTSLDEDQLPRAMNLASLGGKATEPQRGELRRLWESLSPAARGELWMARRDDLLAAGLLDPTVKRAAPDAGSGPYDVKSPGFKDRWTREKMKMIVEGADFGGLDNASLHMAHYLDNDGDPLKLPVDKMMSDDKDFEAHIGKTVVEQGAVWREQALEEFRRNGGRPVAIPVETGNDDFSFAQDKDKNWFYAVGSTRSNVTGVVTVVPDVNGQPSVRLDYQANVWDRYNWDKDKGVTILGMGVPDGEMAKMHTTGLAQEFDMSGSSSVKQYDLGGSAPNEQPPPAPDEPGRDNTREDPGRDQRGVRDDGGHR
ncbi:hypothetical protein AB0L68_40230 [Streptomyces sp. NPDC052164]|uniref:hypothetical protein n=1 Tax=Streptomyces sp. NPDC052164 TaxID=3155529 RepID=UPI003414BED1